MKKYTCFSLCKLIEKQIPKKKKYMALIKLQERGLIQESKPHVYDLCKNAIITQEAIDSIIAEIKGA